MQDGVRIPKHTRWNVGAVFLEGTAGVDSFHRRHPVHLRLILLWLCVVLATRRLLPTRVASRCQQVYILLQLP